MLKIIVIFILTIGVNYCSSNSVNYLTPNDAITFDPRGKSSSDKFRIYCYEGKPKSIIYVWQSMFLNIDLNNEDYTQYDGSTPEAVIKEFEEHRSSWSMNFFTVWRSKKMKLDPFNQSCVGIETNQKYIIELKIIHVDYWKILLLILGIFLYCSAEKLSGNAFFYYACGMSFGVTASFLVLIYILSKFLPRKSFMYGAFLTGWTVTFYLLQLVKENLRVILESYREYLIYYTLGSAAVSFIICYKYGPIKDKKTKNLIKWSLQFAGIFLMFNSSQFHEAAIAQIILLVLIHNMPKSWLNLPANYYKRRFPGKVKLLSNDEYYEQGVRETNKSLEELRKYCLSPECNQWKTALKLKDVKRFASFIEGNSHLSDDEVLEYETSYHHSEFTDDDEDSEKDNYTDDEIHDTQH